MGVDHSSRVWNSETKTCTCQTHSTTTESSSGSSDYHGVYCLTLTPNTAMKTNSEEASNVAWPPVAVAIDSIAAFVLFTFMARKRQRRCHDRSFDKNRGSYERVALNDGSELEMRRMQ